MKPIKLTVGKKALDYIRGRAAEVIIWHKEEEEKGTHYYPGVAKRELACIFMPNSDTPAPSIIAVCKKPAAHKRFRMDELDSAKQWVAEQLDVKKEG